MRTGWCSGCHSCAYCGDCRCARGVMGTASSVNAHAAKKAGIAKAVADAPSQAAVASKHGADSAHHRRHKHKKHRRDRDRPRRGSSGGGGGVDGRNSGTLVVAPTHESGLGGDGRVGSWPQPGPTQASMSLASVGSYPHSGAGSPNAMSGYVWLYPAQHPHDQRHGGATERPPPTRVWMEARLDEGVLVWTDASGPGVPAAFSSGVGFGAGGAGAGGGYGYDTYGATSQQQGQGQGRLDLSQVRSVFPGNSQHRKQSPTRRRGDDGDSSSSGGNDASDTPYAFTVVTWGASLLLQAPNAYEFVGWLSTLRSGVASWGGSTGTQLADYHTSASLAGQGVVMRSSGGHQSGSGGGGGGATTDALFRACHANDVHTIRYLLRGDPKLSSARDYAGDTAIIAAARAGAADVVRLLLRRGVDVTTANVDGQTALVAASGAGHLRCVDAIVRRHRKNNSQASSGGRRLQDKMAAHRASQEAVSALLDKQGLGGLTAAHAAAAGGHVRVLELLLLEGANPFVLDDSGWTVAHYACRCSRSVRCIALLCDAAVDLVDWWDTSGNTPLHIAASGGCVLCWLWLRVVTRHHARVGGIIIRIAHMLVLVARAQVGGRCPAAAANSCQPACPEPARAQAQTPRHHGPTSRVRVPTG